MGRGGRSAILIAKRDQNEEPRDSDPGAFLVAIVRPGDHPMDFFDFAVIACFRTEYNMISHRGFVGRIRNKRTQRTRPVARFQPPVVA
jgi:hypothetical protein